MKISNIISINQVAGSKTVTCSLLTDKQTDIQKIHSGLLEFLSPSSRSGPIIEPGWPKLVLNPDPSDWHVYIMNRQSIRLI